MQQTRHSPHETLQEKNQDSKEETISQEEKENQESKKR
jgi:hypothetical protein